MQDDHGRQYSVVKHRPMEAGPIYVSCNAKSKGHLGSQDDI